MEIDTESKAYYYRPCSTVFPGLEPFQARNRQTLRGFSNRQPKQAQP